MATTQEILDKYRCPECGLELMAPAAENKDTMHWNEIVVWCTDMGHWAGQIKDCDKAL